MGFGFPDAFYFLLLLPPLLWLISKGEKQSREIIQTFRSMPFGIWHGRVRLALVTIFIFSLVCTGAKPYVETNQTGSFLFLVDVTRSMSARYSCAEPTFLDRAKNTMNDIINEIPEAKFGIIAFDRLALPITQITYDRSYLEQAIEYGVHIGLTYDATATNLSNALSVVASKKKRLPEFYNDISYVILLSDGHLEGNYQTRLRLPLDELQKAGIKILSVGIANTGETPIPMTTEEGDCRRDFYTDIEGNTIFIPLRDDILALISAGTGGEYFGEGETDTLVRYLRENGLLTIADEEIGVYQQRDISRFFLILASISLLGLVILSKAQLIKQ